MITYIVSYPCISRLIGDIAVKKSRVTIHRSDSFSTSVMGTSE